MNENIQEVRAAIVALQQRGVEGIEIIERKFLQLAAEMERASEQVRQVKLQWDQASQQILDAFDKAMNRGGDTWPTR